MGTRLTAKERKLTPLRLEYSLLSQFFGAYYPEELGLTGEAVATEVAPRAAPLEDEPFANSGHDFDQRKLTIEKY